MTSTAYRLVPWTDVVEPHDDVKGGALDMGTYAVNLANVFRRAGGVPDVYARPDRFFARTYPTEGLTRLLTDVLTVLAGGAGDRILQLRTPFGGGKTHTLVALLHLVRNRQACLDARPDLSGLPDPGTVQVAVLSGEELDPLSPSDGSGTVTRTMWGELAAQLGRYDLVAEHDANGSAPGGETLRRVLGSGPVLVLLDEVLVYVEKAMAVTCGDSTLGRQVMLFVQALTEAAGSLPHAAMVYSLQASVGEAAGAEGLLAQLDHLVSRKDAKREPVTGAEVMRVVQTRLFEDLGPPAIRAEIAARYADLVERQLVAQADTDDARREAKTEARQLEQRIRDSYPLHPALLDLMYHRWGSLPSYQRTRGALQFLASVTHALLKAGDVSPLIGPGEVDLADPATRSAFFSQVGERERYTSVIDADILGDGSGAKAVDRRISADSPSLAKLKVGTRLATAVMLFSFGGQEGEDRGVLEIDLVAATLVPGVDRNVAVAALHDLREDALYLHHTGRRYRFEPTANLTKMVRDEAVKFSRDEVLDVVRAELGRALGGERGAKLWPATPADVPDGVPAFIFAYLHPDWSADKPPLKDFVEQARGGNRRYRNGIGLVLPDGQQFDRARAAARTQLATGSLVRRQSQLGLTKDQVAELEEKRHAASRDLATAAPRAYATAAVPVRSDLGASAFLIEEVSLRALLTNGLSLHERVREALRHRVFDRLTVAKLIELAGLGPQHSAVACSAVVDGFFSFFQFTKIASAEVVADAVRRAVMERTAAYATGIEFGSGEIRIRDPRRVHLGTALDVEEIDLGGDAFLLTPELAATLRAPADQPQAVSAPAPPPIVEGSGRPDASTARASDPAPGQPIHHVALRARLDGRGLFGLQRALSWLRDEHCDLDVEVTVRASAPSDGLDPVRLRNGVIEPLEEGGAEITQRELS